MYSGKIAVPPGRGGIQHINLQEYSSNKRTYLHFNKYIVQKCIKKIKTLTTGLQINLYLEQPMEIQLFTTFFQRRK
jgi:hypothetical protein